MARRGESRRVGMTDADGAHSAPESCTPSTLGAFDSRQIRIGGHATALPVDASTCIGIESAIFGAFCLENIREAVVAFVAFIRQELVAARRRQRQRHRP